MKTLGIAALLLSGIGCSVLLSRELDERTRNVRALCKMLRFIKRMVDSFSMSARDILREAPRDLIAACGYPYEQAGPCLLDFAENCQISDVEARLIFFEFARSFGKNYRDEQVRECEYYIERMEERERVVSQRLPVQKKLVFALTLCLTLILAILLI